MLVRMLFTVLAIVVSMQPLFGEQAQKPLDALSFLVGHWRGAGTGEPGNSVGVFSFEWDLAKSVLIRKSFAEYPATKDRPASRHDDLMIVYVDAGKLKADYFDTEGHTIHYAVSVSADGKSLEFLSDKLPSTPRYRLTYTRAGGANSMKLKFEIADPGKDGFTTYIDAALQRKP
jgi:hypothetical protein